MTHTTAGKGPGVTFVAEDRSAAVRVALRLEQKKALLQVANFRGASAEIGLTHAQVLALARALNRVAETLRSASKTEEHIPRTQTRGGARTDEVQAPRTSSRTPGKPRSP